MNTRQKIMKAIYPLIIGWGKLTGRKSNVLTNKTTTMPAQSFYQLTVQMNNGAPVQLSEFKGKKVLLVNTASNCGYTAQYDDLQKLNEQFRDKLVIIGFPANDFQEQEKGSDEEIAQFCRVNFGVTFPLAKKSTVVPGNSQNEVFQWLTNKDKNGWNSQPPTWNFSKYLVNEEGALTHYFDPGVSPMSKEVTNAIEK
jgi:glutathione peroxidase